MCSPMLSAHDPVLIPWESRGRVGQTGGGSVISKRMVKKQQMRWTPRGAHLLLQIRVRVLNDDLAADFHRWYPNFRHQNSDTTPNDW